MERIGPKNPNALLQPDARATGSPNATVANETPDRPSSPVGGLYGLSLLPRVNQNRGATGVVSTPVTSSTSVKSVFSGSSNVAQNPLPIDRFSPNPSLPARNGPDVPWIWEVCYESHCEFRPVGEAVRLNDIYDKYREGQLEGRYGNESLRDFIAVTKSMGAPEKTMRFDSQSVNVDASTSECLRIGPTTYRKGPGSEELNLFTQPNGSGPGWVAWNDIYEKYRKGSVSYTIKSQKDFIAVIESIWGPNTVKDYVDECGPVFQVKPENPEKIIPRIIAFEDKEFNDELWKWNGSKEARNRIRAAYTNKAKALDLNDLGLTTLPDCFSKMFSLEQLSVNNNSLKKLPTLLPTMLKVLNADNNQIEEITEVPKELEVLSVNNNKIKKVKNLPRSLNILRLRNNQLTELPNLDKKNFPHFLGVLDYGQSSLANIHTILRRDGLQLGNNPWSGGTNSFIERRLDSECAKFFR